MINLTAAVLIKTTWPYVVQKVKKLTGKEFQKQRLAHRC